MMDLSKRLPAQGAKICGIRTVADYHHCHEVGAAFIGMVFFEKSPRHLSFEEAAQLRDCARADGPLRVALTVDPTMAYLDEIIEYAAPDIIQLHGAETPQQAAAIRAATNLPVMKAIRVRDSDDIAAAEAYFDVVDMLLFDAYAPQTGLPGGTGHQFDWQLVANLSLPLPWMLAGGLSAETLGDAKAQTGAHYFDVSSAVEGEKGVKDHEKITAFVKAAQK